MRRLDIAICFTALIGLIVTGAATAQTIVTEPVLQQEQAGEKQEWVSLFNGKDLTGWTVKIANHKLGENYANTFRVEDGILKCEYDDYQEFGGRFGHLYSNLSY